MHPPVERARIITDASKLMIEASTRAGADVFVGYPITPANLLYHYAGKRFPVMLAAPDEITTVQWMTGFAAMGQFPVTATSFPGFALMVESVNMAFMMELPMLIILAQRLGPSTGSATTSADGDLLGMRGTLSGGYELPVFSTPSPEDCWSLTHRAVACAIELRTPVVLLTSKEIAMTQFTVSREQLPALSAIDWDTYCADAPYIPYHTNGKDVPAFLPLGDPTHQVRINASTHDFIGHTRKGTKDALDNTRRLHRKIQNGMSPYLEYEHMAAPGARTLVVTHGITAAAAREAQAILAAENLATSVLITKTMLPVPDEYYRIADSYSTVIFVEENLTGHYRELMYGRRPPERVKTLGKIAELISPEEIVAAVKQWNS